MYAPNAIDRKPTIADAINFISKLDTFILSTSVPNSKTSIDFLFYPVVTTECQGRLLCSRQFVVKSLN